MWNAIQIEIIKTKAFDVFKIVLRSKYFVKHLTDMYVSDVHKTDNIISKMTLKLLFQLFIYYIKITCTYFIIVNGNIGI